MRTWGHFPTACCLFLSRQDHGKVKAQVIRIIYFRLEFFIFGRSEGNPFLANFSILDMEPRSPKLETPVLSFEFSFSRFVVGESRSHCVEIVCQNYNRISITGSARWIQVKSGPILNCPRGKQNTISFIKRANHLWFRSRIQQRLNSGAWESDDTFWSPAKESQKIGAALSPFLGYP